tara:strand:+ start:70 stop:1308 length:1239 start_codon:yes stop_codon:yes gene_type:complete
MNAIENLLIAPIKSLNREIFNNHLKNLNYIERKKLITGICNNKFSSIYLKYIFSEKIDVLFTKSELSILKNHANRFQIQNLEIVKEVLHIDRIFKENNLSPVYLKGVALMKEYEDISLRPSNDIDILFKEKEVFKAYEILKNNGYMEFRNIQLSKSELVKFSKEKHHLPELCRKTRIMIELHHRVTSVQDFEKCPLSQKIFNEKVSFDFYGTRIFKPSLNDLITHLILHYSIQNFFNNSLRIFFDIHQIKKNYNIDWEGVIQSHKNNKLKKAILLTLEILNRDLKLVKDFESFKDKFFIDFPSDEIIKVCIKKTFDLDKKNIHPKTLLMIDKSNNFISIFKIIMNSILSTKKDAIHDKRITKKNHIKILYFSLIKFFEKINIYFSSVIKLIFNQGKISKDYYDAKKIQKWMN